MWSSERAIAAKANLIVTGDSALLAVAECCGVRIVSVVEALRVANTA
jgi:predicted nucleic acid-binding protein